MLIKVKAGIFLSLGTSVSIPIFVDSAKALFHLSFIKFLFFESSNVSLFIVSIPFLSKGGFITETLSIPLSIELES